MDGTGGHHVKQSKPATEKTNTAHSTLLGKSEEKLIGIKTAVYWDQEGWEWKIQGQIVGTEEQEEKRKGFAVVLYVVSMVHNIAGRVTRKELLGCRQKEKLRE